MAILSGQDIGTHRPGIDLSTASAASLLSFIPERDSGGGEGEPGFSRGFSMGVHAKLAPSAMERWVACPASPRLCVGLTSVSSPAAQEGSLAHKQAERFLRGQLPAQEFHNMPEEMRAAVYLYFETIEADTRTGDTLLVEHHFDLSSIDPDCGGTADAVLWSPSSRTLRVYDFKYGKGHHVNVEGNYQLQYYALGAVVTLGYPARQIEIVVVQPRCPSPKGKVRRWMFDAMDILEFESFLRERVAVTKDPNAPVVMGRHCYWCPAKDQTCPEYAKTRKSGAAAAFAGIQTEDPDPFAGL